MGLITSLTEKPLTIVIKIGTEAITPNRGPVDEVFLKRVVDEIAQIKKTELSNGNQHFVLLVTSGATGTGRAMISENPLLHLDHISAARSPNDKYYFHAKKLLPGMGQVRLMGIYGQYLAPHNMAPHQILVTDKDMEHGNIHRAQLNADIAFLRDTPSLLGIANGNDVLMDESQTVTENDILSKDIAAIARADVLIMISTARGFYTANPKTHSNAKLIPLIDCTREDGAPQIDTNGTSDGGTGGAKSKLDNALEAAADGTQVHIIGPEHSLITDVFSEQRAGTTIIPNPRRPEWLDQRVHNIKRARARAQVLMNGG